MVTPKRKVILIYYQNRVFFRQAQRSENSRACLFLAAVLEFWREKRAQMHINNADGIEAEPGQADTCATAITTNKL
jgi:hypothetical protein